MMAYPAEDEPISQRGPLDKAFHDRGVLGRLAVLEFLGVLGLLIISALWWVLNRLGFRRGRARW